jgi:pimeloyl-ACP methyl ester carboxylesterase
VTEGWTTDLKPTDIDPDDLAPAGWRQWSEFAWHLPRFLAGLGPLGPRGPEDGTPTLVLPGFLASDRGTMELRRALARGGFRSYPWEMGMNRGAQADTFGKLEARLAAVNQETGGKVLLVGWSLGGLFARELARAHPDQVRAVVTLGSPFSGDLRTNTNVRALYEWVAKHKVDEPPFPRIEAKPPVPCLAIWSRLDGVVAPSAARGRPDESDRQVEIPSSHMAFAVYRPVLSKVVGEIRKFLEDYPG